MASQDRAVTYRALEPGDAGSLQVGADVRCDDCAARAAAGLSAMPLRPDQALHNLLFPIVYEEEFFRKATLGLDGISSFVALAEEQLVGFVTFRTCSVSECEDKARAKRQKCESNRSRPAPPPRLCHRTCWERAFAGSAAPEGAWWRTS